MKNILYWQNILTTQECAQKEPEIIATLELIKQGEYQRVNLKKLKGSKIPLYRAKINEKERLIFAIITHHDEKSLLLIDILRDHKYENCLFLKDEYLKKYLDELDPNELLVFMNADFSEIEEIEDIREIELLTPETKSHEWQAAFYYHQQQILLDPSQQELINCRLPAFVEGVAGSGKTCTGFAKILNEANDQKKKKQILYITMSSHLINEMHDEWAKVKKNRTRTQVSFINYKDFLEVIANQFKELNLNLVTIKHFREWLGRRIKREDASILRDLSIDLMTSEARFLSGLEISLFDQPCFITDLSKKELFNLIFQEYQNYLKEIQTVNIQLTKLKAKHPIADLIIVDEAQAFSGAQLQNIKNAVFDSQVMYCYDQYQNLVDDVDHLKWLMHSISQEKDSTRMILTRGHRCQSKVAAWANRTLDLRALVSGKRKAATSHARLTSTSNNGHCDWISGSVFESKGIASQFNVNNCNWAVVVTSEEHILQARALFGGTLNVFTQEQIRGLEYEYVILLSPFDDPAFKKIQMILKKQGDTQKYLNVSDQERLECRIALSKLFTASTRSKGSLLIVSDKAEYRVLNDFLLPSELVAQKEIEVKSSLTEESSEQEWLAKAIKMIKEGLETQATDILIKHCPSVDPEEVFRSIRNLRTKSSAFAQSPISTSVTEDFASAIDDDMDQKEVIFSSSSSFSDDNCAASCMANEDTHSPVAFSCVDRYDSKEILLSSPKKSSKLNYKKKNIQESLDRQTILLLEDYLRSEIKTPKDIFKIFYTHEKKPLINVNMLRVFEQDSKYLTLFKDIISNLNFDGYYPLVEINGLLETDPNFFNQLILSINNQLSFKFFEIDQGIGSQDAEFSQNLKKRIYFIRELLLTILNISCIKDIDNDKKEMLAEEFLIMLDYYAAEGHLGAVNNYFLEIWNKNGDGYFLFDEIWNTYDKKYFPYRQQFSLGELFLKIKYPNQDLIYAILLYHPDCFDDIQALFEKQILVSSDFIKYQGYEKLLTIAYLKAKFYCRTDSSFYTERFIDLISQKIGLQELLTLLSIEPNFLEDLDSAFWLMPRSQFEDFSESYYLEYGEIDNDFNRLSNQSWLHTWFVNCLKNNDIWPEFREFLFFTKNPFMEIILDILKEADKVENTFLGHNNTYLFLNAFLSQENNNHVCDFRRSLLSLCFSLEKIQECVQLNYVKGVRLITVGTLIQIGNELFDSSNDHPDLAVREKSREIYQILCQKDVTNFEKLLSDPLNIVFINNKLKYYFDLLQIVILTNNYEFLLILKRIGFSLAYDKIEKSSGLLYANRIKADKKIFDLIDLDNIEAAGGFNIEVIAEQINQQNFALEFVKLIQQSLKEFNEHKIIQIVQYLLKNQEQEFVDSIDIYDEVLKLSIECKNEHKSSLSLFSKFHKLLNFNFQNYQLADLINPISLYNSLLTLDPESHFEYIVDELDMFEFAFKSIFQNKLNPKGFRNVIHIAVLHSRAHEIELFKNLGADCSHQDHEGFTPIDLFLKMTRGATWSGKEHDLCDVLTRSDNIDDLPKITLRLDEISHDIREILYVKGYLDSQKNSMLAPEEVANESISFFVSVLNSMVFKNYKSMCFKVSKMLKDKILDTNKIVAERALFEEVLKFINDQTYDYLLGWLKFDEQKRVHFIDLILDSILNKNLSNILIKFLKDNHWDQMIELWAKLHSLLINGGYNLDQKEDVMFSYLLRMMALVENSHDRILKRFFYLKTSRQIVQKYEKFHHNIAENIIDLCIEAEGDRDFSFSIKMDMNSCYSGMALRYIDTAIKDIDPNIICDDLMDIATKALKVINFIHENEAISVVKRLLLVASNFKDIKVIQYIYRKFDLHSLEPYPERTEEEILMMRRELITANSLKQLILLHRQRGCAETHPGKKDLADIGSIHHGFKSHPRDALLYRQAPLIREVMANLGLESNQKSRNK